MTTELRDPEQIRTTLQRLHRERAQMIDQLTNDEHTVKAIPLKIKELSEHIEFLEARLRDLVTAPTS